MVEPYAHGKFMFSLLNKRDTMAQHRARAFMSKLRERGVPDYMIGTNDWQTSTKIRVYIAGKPYERFGKANLKNALKRLGR